MKSVFVISAAFWLGIVLEHSRPDLIPAYSLLLPICSVGMMSCPGNRVIILTGCALITKDLLSMNPTPFVTVTVLLVGTWLGTRPDGQCHSPEWLRRAILLLSMGATSHLASRSLVDGFHFQDLTSWVLVGIPAFSFSAMVYRISQEFRLRYSL